MVIASLLEQRAVYWSILYSHCSPFGERWWFSCVSMCVCVCVCMCMCLCVYKHHCRKRKKIQGSSTASTATCLPWLPRQQQCGQSNRVLESSNGERVNGAMGRRDGATGSCREIVHVSQSEQKDVWNTQCCCVSLSLTDRKMIKHEMLCFLLSAPVESVLSCRPLHSAQADDRVRVEKRDSAQFEFTSAMNTVTEFYCHTQEKGVFLHQSFYSSLPAESSSTLTEHKTHGQL